MAKLNISLFGSFQVCLDGAPITQFESVKVRALLATLAVEYTRPQPRERLAGLLWPDWPQQSAMSNLRYALADLRKNIGDQKAQPPFLLISRESIQLNCDADIWVDVGEFEAAISEQGSPSRGEALRSFHPFDRNAAPQQSAIALYRGPFLEGFSLSDSAPFEQWLLAKREHFSQQMLKALQQLAGHYERSGEYEPAQRYVQQQLELEPWREEAHQQLMRLLALQGQRSAALAQYEKCRQALRDGLGVDPGVETVTLYDRIREGTLTPEQPPGTAAVSHKESPTQALRPRHNLPSELTSFIGRQAEIVQLTALLTSDDQRLVTLTGSGGTGKTRLALRAAQALLDEFEDGIWLVELAPVDDPDLVALTIAQALGLHEVAGIPIKTTLAGYLSDKRLLLVLDNCEHLLAECSSLVDHLLKSAPRLHMLATSREILGVPGETSFRVQSLSVPETQQLPPVEQLTQFDAVHLFVERASRATLEFVLNEANAAAVANICRRLDGIPLAIELAAARVRAMAVPQIAARLDNVFRLLTGGSRSVQPRQQTLKATFDWSYTLLSPQEKLALQRLSAFAGSWTLAAAESVLSGDGIEPFEVLDLISQLVDKSLILAVFSPIGTVRYRMLETVRQYGRDRLLEGGGGEAVRDRHLGYYLQLGAEAGEGLRSSLQLAWMARLEDELENLRLALEWSLAGRLEDGLRLASALMWFWHFHNRDSEGAQWLKELLEVEEAARGPQPLAVGTQSISYLLDWSQAISSHVFFTTFAPGFYSMEQRKALMEANINLCRAIGEQASRELAWALIVIGPYVRQQVGQPISFFKESLEICRRKQYRFYEAECLFNWSNEIIYEDIMIGVDLLESSLAICRSLGDPDAIATRLASLSQLEFQLGNYERARTLMKEGLDYYRKVGNLGGWGFFSIWQYYMFSNPENARQAEEALAYIRNQRQVEVHIEEFCVFARTEWSVGNYDRAERIAQEALSASSQSEAVWEKFYPRLLLGRIALSQGDRDQARQYFAAVFSSVGDDKGIDNKICFELLDFLAVFFTAQGQMAQAAKVFGAVDEKYRYWERGALQRMRSEHDAALTAVRQALGEVGFARVWNEGLALTLWQAFEGAKQTEGWEV